MRWTDMYYFSGSNSRLQKVQPWLKVVTESTSANYILPAHISTLSFCLWLLLFYALYLLSRNDDPQIDDLAFSSPPLSPPNSSLYCRSDIASFLSFQNHVRFRFFGSKLLDRSDLFDFEANQLAE